MIEFYGSPKQGKRARMGFFSGETVNWTGDPDCIFQTIYNVPWWLLLRQPAHVIEDKGIGEFLRLYEPRKDQFIRAMKRVESSTRFVSAKPLSARMQESWDSGRFRFNLASRCSFDVDEIYWATLHRKVHDEVILDRAVLDEKGAFIQRKMDQFEEYQNEKKKDARFENS